MYTADHTHYSVVKIAEIMGLISIKISGNDDGSMNLKEFKEKMEDLNSENASAGVIVLCTYGTT